MSDISKPQIHLISLAQHGIIVQSLVSSGACLTDGYQIVPLSRTLATPVQTARYADPVTHTSTLSNGFSVSSETIPGMSTSTVALYIDAGSRADSMNASGAAHFLEVSRGSIVMNA